MTLSNTERLNKTRRTVSRSTTRRRLHGWVVTIWLLLMLIISWADKGVVGLAAVPIMHDLHLTPGQFGLVGSSLFFLFSLSSVVVGLIANRVQTRWILAVLVMLWSVAQVPVLLVSALPALLGSRILLGAAEGPTTPLYAHAVAKWFPDRERSVPQGIGNTGGSLGLAIAAPVLTLVIVKYGWQSAFLVLAVVGVIWTLVWLLIGHDGPFNHWADTMSAEATEPGEVEREPEPHIPYRKILASGTWIGALLGGFTGYWSLAMSTTWLPAYLENGLHYSATSAGSMVGLPPLFGAIAAVLFTAVSGWLLRRGVSTRWVRGAFAGGITAVCGACLLLFAHVPTGGLQIVLMVFAFGIPVATFPLGVLALAEIVPVGQRAAVLSFSTAAATLAGLIAPAVTGWIIGNADSAEPGYVWAFTLAAVLMIIGGLIGMLLIHPQRDARRFGLAAPEQ